MTLNKEKEINLKLKQQHKSLIQQTAVLFGGNRDRQKKQSQNQAQMFSLNQHLTRKIGIEQKFNIKIPNYYTKQQHGRVLQVTPAMLPSTYGKILNFYDEGNYEKSQQQIEKLANISEYQIIVNHLAKVENLKKKLQQEQKKNRQFGLSFETACQKKYQGSSQDKKTSNVFSDILFLLTKGMYESALARIRKDLNPTDSNNFTQIAQAYGCFKGFLDHIERSSQIKAIKELPFKLEMYLQSDNTKKFKKIINQSLINKNRIIVQCADRIGTFSTQKEFQYLTDRIQLNYVRTAFKKVNQRFDDLRTIVNTWETSINRIRRRQQLEFDLALLHQNNPNLNDIKYLRTKKINQIDPLVMPNIKEIQRLIRSINNSKQMGFQTNYSRQGEHMLASVISLGQKVNTYNIFNSPNNFTRNKPNQALMGIQTYLQKANILVDKIIFGLENLLFNHFQEIDTDSYPYKGQKIPSKEAMIDWYLDQIRVQLPKKVQKQAQKKQIDTGNSQKNNCIKESLKFKQTIDASEPEIKPSNGIKILDQNHSAQTTSIKLWTQSFIKNVNLGQYMKDKADPKKVFSEQFRDTYWLQTDLRRLYEQSKWSDFFIYISKAISTLMLAAGNRQQYIKDLQEQFEQYSNEIVSRIQQLQGNKKNRKNKQKSFSMLFSDLLSCMDDLRQQNLTLVLFKEESVSNQHVQSRFLQQIQLKNDEIDYLKAEVDLYAKSLKESFQRHQMEILKLNEYQKSEFAIKQIKRLQSQSNKKDFRISLFESKNESQKLNFQKTIEQLLVTIEKLQRKISSQESQISLKKQLQKQDGRSKQQMQKRSKQINQIRKKQDVIKNQAEIIRNQAEVIKNQTEQQAYLNRLLKQKQQQLANSSSFLDQQKASIFDKFKRKEDQLNRVISRLAAQKIKIEEQMNRQILKNKQRLEKQRIIRETTSIFRQTQISNCFPILDWKNESIRKSNQFLRGSFIVENLDDQKFIYQQIGVLISKKPEKAKLLYRMDALNKVNPHLYIDKKENIIILIKTPNQTIGAFVTSAFDHTKPNQFDENGNAIIFSIDKKQVYKKLKGKGSIKNEGKYLIIGNSDLMINLATKVLSSNLGKPRSHFEGKQTYIILNEKKGFNEVQLQSYQIFAVEFSEQSFEKVQASSLDLETHQTKLQCSKIPNDLKEDNKAVNSLRCIQQSRVQLSMSWGSVDQEDDEQKKHQ